VTPFKTALGAVDAISVYGGSMDSAGESAQRRIERLRQQEAECVARLESIRKQIAAWETGLEGEKKIAEVLAELPSGWWVLHDRRKSSRSPANIDHVVIGPTGVHIIDTKNWAGKVWLGDKGVICGRRPMAEEAKALAETRDLVARELVRLGSPAPVFGVIAFASSATSTELLVHEGIAYVPPDLLLQGFTRPVEVLTPEQAYRLWELLDDLHPQRAAAVQTRAPRAPHRRRSSAGRRPPLPRPSQRGVRSSRSAGPATGRTLLKLTLGLVGVAVAGLLAFAALDNAVHNLPGSVTPATSTTGAPATSTSPATVGGNAATSANRHPKKHHKRS
jgi:hypothetical protein